MYGWVTKTEIETAMAERVQGKKRERVHLSTHRGINLRGVAQTLLSLIF